jgi:hypothetical protein
MKEDGKPHSCEFTFSGSPNESDPIQKAVNGQSQTREEQRKRMSTAR